MDGGGLHVTHQKDGIGRMRQKTKGAGKKGTASRSVQGAMKAKSSREKVRAYRERMRKAGMRKIEIWVPDTRTPEFAAEAARQARLVAKSAAEGEDLAFIESLFNGWPDE